MTDRIEFVGLPCAHKKVHKIICRRFDGNVIDGELLLFNNIVPRVESELQQFFVLRFHLCESF